MGTTISESARIGSGSTGAASGIRLRRVVQPVFNDNACGKHRLMVIPQLSYNFLEPLRKRVLWCVVFSRFTEVTDVRYYTYTQLHHG